ncbi:hypothetical protein [Thermoleophilum album]|nr:hypothetical protein [Thermoleophilum album]
MLRTLLAFGDNVAAAALAARLATDAQAGHGSRTADHLRSHP